MSEPELRPLRRHPTYVRLWIAATASLVGSAATQVAFPLLVLATTGSALEAGLVGFLRLLPWFALGLPVGMLADRMPWKVSIAGADACACLAAATIPVALLVDRLTFAQIVAVVTVEGACGVLRETAEPRALRAALRSEQLDDAIARNWARGSLAGLVGPSLGGLLYGLGALLPFVFDAVSYGVAALLVASGPSGLAAGAARLPRRFREELLAGIVWLWRTPFLRTATLQAAASNVISSGMTVTLIVVARTHGASAAAVGAMIGVIGAEGILGSLAAPRLRRALPPRLIVVGTNWVGFVVLVALHLVSHPLLLGLLWGIRPFFSPAWNATVVGYQLRVVPPDLAARTVSAETMLSYAGGTAGPLVAGLLLGVAGGSTTLFAFAGLALAIATAGSLARSLRGPEA